MGCSYCQAKTGRVPPSAIQGTARLKEHSCATSLSQQNLLAIFNLDLLRDQICKSQNVMHGKGCFHKGELGCSPKQSNQPFLLTRLHFNPLLTGLIADLQFIPSYSPFTQTNLAAFTEGQVD